MLIGYLEENPLLTLKELSNRLRTDTGVSVSPKTIHQHLDGRMYSVKKARAVPATMNSEDNRRRRAEYVSAHMAAVGHGKVMIYVDETNINLFLRRSCGRSKKGTRCLVKTPTSKGKNLHIIGAITQTGLVFWERRRGSYTKEECHEWTRRMLRAAGISMDQVVIVVDNAPCHSGLVCIAFFIISNLRNHPRETHIFLVIVVNRSSVAPVEPANYAPLIRQLCIRTLRVVPSFNHTSLLFKPSVPSSFIRNFDVYFLCT